MTRKYTNEDVYNALKDIDEGASIAASARKFGVPRSKVCQRKEVADIQLSVVWDLKQC